MEVNLANLPDDSSLLKQIIRDLAAVLKLTQHRLDQLLRAKFGPRTEKIDAAQLLLFAQQILAQGKMPAEEPASEPVADQPKGHGRRRPPKELPRKRIFHEVKAEDRLCKCCGQPMTQIGEQISEQLEHIPASLYIIEHVCPKFACKHCPDGSVVTADKPRQPIEKGLPGPGLMAYVGTSKYADHIPLNRLSGMLLRQGVHIHRSTMCDWMAVMALILRPLYRRMIERVLAGRIIWTDDTPVPVLDKERSKTRQGHLWVYIGDQLHPFTVYDYTPNHKRDGPVNFLGDYHGYMQADAFRGYDGIFAGEKVIEVACFAHARRKFHDCISSDPELAHVALAWISKLYDVERAAKHQFAQQPDGPDALPLADIRLRLRQERSVPVLEQLGTWLRQTSQLALPKSPIGQAIGYALSNWAALNRYVQDGELEIDNNRSERAMRPIGTGRKNWMFAGSDAGGHTAAVLYSFVASARQHGHDPFVYFRDVLTRIADLPVSQLDDLLPDRWQRAEQPTTGAQPTDSTTQLAAASATPIN